MAEKLRRFTDSGMKAFSEQINNIKSGTISQIPEWLIFDPNYSELLSTEVMIENKQFLDKHDMAIYLNGVIDGSGIQNPFSDRGLWSWLAAFYFDQLCKRGRFNQAQKTDIFCMRSGRENIVIL